MDEVDEVRQSTVTLRGGWRRVAVWRWVALVYAVVAVTCGLRILTSSVAYWVPCFGVDYDSDPCNVIQSHEAGATWSAQISSLWGVAAAAALLTAALFVRTGAPRRLIAGILIPTVVVNPLTDYFITPLVNGHYMSYDAHPGSGIPMGAAVTLAGVVAATVAMVVTDPPRRR